MSKEELDNLVRIKKLKVEPGSRAEFDGMVGSARKRLTDAQNESLDPDSQFDLEHFPEKWVPVFRRKCDQAGNLERVPDSN